MMIGLYLKTIRAKKGSVGWETLVWIILGIIGIILAAVIIGKFLMSGGNAIDMFKVLQ